MDQIWPFVAAPVMRFVTPGDPFCLPFLLGALVTALLCYVARRPSRPLRRLCAFLRAAASSPGWLHRSSLVDYKLFAFTAFFFASGIGSYFVTSEGAQFAMQWTLSTIAGPAPVADHVNPLVAVPMAVAYVLLYDLGYWLAHFMMHRSPILWEFHKVHHSAEVLTPFTEYRQHPVELVLFPVFIGIGTGCVYAVAEHVFGMQAQGLSLFSINALMLAFMLTFLHLRHSQLWIPARGWLGRIVQSPAHHQIHHSTDPKHFDKNLGLCLSLWDWAFGTLYVPNEREELEFGLDTESQEHDRLLRTLWLPVDKSARLVSASIQKRIKP